MSLLNKALAALRRATGARPRDESEPPASPILPEPRFESPPTQPIEAPPPARTAQTVRHEPAAAADAQPATEPDGAGAAPLEHSDAPVIAFPAAAPKPPASAAPVPAAAPPTPPPTVDPVESRAPDAEPPPRKPPNLYLAKRAPPWPPERLSLALQGGGSFGAFAWGVLDRLLEEPGLDFDAVSGSSAGAVNAVLLASGMIDGGREGARARLSRFWKRASQAAALVPQTSALSAGLELVIRILSPYQFNPFNVNPLREALTAEVDFARLRERSKIKLLLGATRVRDGSLRILTNEELTVDAVLASACLPLLHHAIELDGEPYWDGGYAGNPPLIPLVRASDSAHILIVQVTPNMTDRLPKTTGEIAARIEQIQFNATLNTELEALKYGKIVGAADKLRRLRIGRISADDHFEKFGAESAGNLRWEFLERLHLGGRAAAEQWLKQDLPALRRGVAAS